MFVIFAKIWHRSDAVAKDFNIVQYIGVSINSLNFLSRDLPTAGVMTSSEETEGLSSDLAAVEGTRQLRHHAKRASLKVTQNVLHSDVRAGKEQW